MRAWGGRGFRAAAYVFVSIVYSAYLKTLALLDVVAVAAMFPLRVAMGIELIGVVLTPWLPLFIMLFFGGMTAAKRTTELVIRIRQKEESNNRRGYTADDLVLLIGCGVIFSIGGLIVLSLYLALVAGPDHVYRSPVRLWATVPLLLLWVLRVWLFAVRSNLLDDPVVFSLTDRFSLATGALVGLSVLSAHLP